MTDQHSHFSDEQLLQELEGQLSASEAKRVRAHWESCWQCRTRRHDLENAISAFVHHWQDEATAFPVPPIEGPRALLRAQLAERSQKAVRFSAPPIRLALAALAAAFLCLFAFIALRPNNDPDVVRFLPDAKLTPGATLLVSRQDVCGQPNPNNKTVPATLVKQVFREYGLSRVNTRAYEIDYLVTPALGGADDIHNLWPHSYSATDWNAHVKDALEDRLHHMVCSGDIDLKEAQQEIAVNWIAAYKKYFRTDHPAQNQ